MVEYRYNFGVKMVFVTFWCTFWLLRGQPPFSAWWLVLIYGLEMVAIVIYEKIVNNMVRKVTELAIIKKKAKR